MNDTRRTIEGIGEKAGTEFEEAFIDDMIIHHEGALRMAALVPQKTDRPELLKLSSDIIDAQTREIELLRQWKAEWFK